MARVFVYGTLRRGECRDLRENFGGGRFCGRGRVTGVLYDLGDYPGLRIGGGGGRVVGEIFEVSRETLVLLDRLEGYDPANVAESEYTRVLVPVVWDDEGIEGCSTYEIAEWHCAGRARIDGGDWVRHRIGA